MWATNARHDGGLLLMFGEYLYRRKYRDESVPHIPETLRPDISAEVDVSIAVIVILISVPALMVAITVSITVQFSVRLK